MPVGMVKCDGCDGCGYVTDTLQRIPWVWHTRELRDANDQPLFPEASRVVCGKCEGSGRILHSRLSMYARKQRRF